MRLRCICYIFVHC